MTRFRIDHQVDRTDDPEVGLGRTGDQAFGIDSRFRGCGCVEWSIVGLNVSLEV